MAEKIANKPVVETAEEPSAVVSEVQNQEVEQKAVEPIEEAKEKSEEPASVIE